MALREGARRGFAECHNSFSFYKNEFGGIPWVPLGTCGLPVCGAVWVYGVHYAPSRILHRASTHAVAYLDAVSTFEGGLG